LKGREEDLRGSVTVVLVPGGGEGAPWRQRRKRIYSVESNQLKLKSI